MLGIPDPYGPVVRGLLLAIIVVLWTVMLVRMVGLRSFSKMTAFDFVTTVATGSLIAQAATRAVWSEYIQALAAMAGIFLAQFLLAKLRQRSDLVSRAIKNQPVLLMENGEYLDRALEKTRVSRSNLREKLRLANISHPSEVKAVVLETTGDISVLRGPDFDPCLLEGVQRL